MPTATSGDNAQQHRVTRVRDFTHEFPTERADISSCDGYLVDLVVTLQEKSRSSTPRSQ